MRTPRLNCIPVLSWETAWLIGMHTCEPAESTSRDVCHQPNQTIVRIELQVAGSVKSEWFALVQQVQSLQR
jgi:hypothetical protein